MARELFTARLEPPTLARLREVKAAHGGDIESAMAALLDAYGQGDGATSRAVAVARRVERLTMLYLAALRNVPMAADGLEAMAGELPAGGVVQQAAAHDSGRGEQDVRADGPADGGKGSGRKPRNRAAEKARRDARIAAVMANPNHYDAEVYALDAQGAPTFNADGSPRYRERQRSACETLEAARARARAAMAADGVG